MLRELTMGFRFRLMFVVVLSLEGLCGRGVCQEALGEAVPTVPSAASPNAASTKDAQARPVTVTVELFTGLKITGVLVDNMQLTMATTFGQASIPAAEVAAVRLAARDDSTTTIVMLNGDSITGATDLKIVTVETEWGSAKINGSAIQSIFFVPDVQWSRTNSISGPRWILVDNKTQPAATTGTVPTTGTVNSTGANSGAAQPTIPLANPGTVPRTLPAPSFAVPR